MHCANIKSHQNSDKFIQTMHVRYVLRTYLNFKANQPMIFKFDENLIQERDAYDCKILLFYIVIQ